MAHNDGVLQVHHDSSSNKKQNEQESIHKVSLRGNRNRNRECQTKHIVLEICIPSIDQRLQGFPLARVLPSPMLGYGIEQISSQTRPFCAVLPIYCTMDVGTVAIVQAVLVQGVKPEIQLLRRDTSIWYCNGTLQCFVARLGKAGV